MFVVRLLALRSLEVLWKFQACWSNCLEYLSSNTFTVLHIYREGNEVADLLSKKAIASNGLNWSFQLSVLKNEAHAHDVLGFGLYRFLLTMKLFFFLGFSFGFLSQKSLTRPSMWVLLSVSLMDCNTNQLYLLLFYFLIL